MTKQVQRRRGTAAQHTGFTGAEGEISVNTTRNSVHVHDGVTAGGIEAARADMGNVSGPNILSAAGITATTTELNFSSGVTSGIQTQLNSKAPINNATFTGTTAIPSATITGGTINNTSIGATTQSTGAFTTLTASSTATFNALSSSGATITGGTINGTTIGATTASTGAFTTLSASTSLTTPLITRAGTIALSATGANVVTASTNGVERLRVTAAGDVGIGTVPSSDSRLHVQSGGSFTYLRVQNNGTAVGNIFLGSEGSANQLLSRDGTSGNRPFAFTIGSSERMRIDSAGNVGIGTSSPATALHVSGANATFRLDNNGQEEYSVRANTPIAGAIFHQYFNRSTSAYLDNVSQALSYQFLRDTGAEVMRITSAGLVGIGTSSPTSALTVNGLITGTAVTQSLNDTTPNRLTKVGDFGLGIGTIPVTDFTSTEVNVGRIFRALSTATGGPGINASYVALPFDGSPTTHFVGVGPSNILRIGTKIGATATPTWSFAYGPSNISDIDATTNQIFRVNSTERMRIDASGALLVGTTTNSYGGDIRVYTEGVNNGGAFAATGGETAIPLGAWNKATSGSARRLITFFVGGGAIVGTITSNGSATAYNTTSDYRLKEDVQPMVGSVDRLMALKPVNFAWKVDGSRVDGFLAHEAQEVVPEAVTGSKDAVDKDGKPQYQGIDQSKIVPLLTAALQEALKRIEALEAQINS